jgi:hypothetical protein
MAAVAHGERPETGGTQGEHPTASHHVPKLHMSNAMPSRDRWDTCARIYSVQQMTKAFINSDR